MNMEELYQKHKPLICWVAKHYQWALERDPSLDMDDLLHIYELKERLLVCRVVIAHLGARKETRWHAFAENTDYPDTSEEWLRYVNSVYKNGSIEIRFRELDDAGLVS